MICWVDESDGRQPLFLIFFEKYEAGNQMIYRMKRIWRWFYIFFAVLMPGMLFGLLGVMWSAINIPSWLGTKSVVDPFSTVLFGMMGIITLTLGGLAIFTLCALAYLAAMNWKYQLDFGETSFRFCTIYHPIIKPIQRDYSEIARISRGRGRGVIKVTFLDRKEWQVGLAGWEGQPNAIFTELARRVDARRIEPGLPQLAWKYLRLERLMLIFSVPYLLIMMIAAYPSLGHDWVRSNVAWKSVVTTKIFSFTPPIDAYSFDANYNPWIIRSRSSFSDEYQIEHISPEENTTWDLSVINPAMSNVMSSPQPNGIGYDAHGYPWVIFDRGAMYWDGQTWQTVFFPISVPGRFNDEIAISSPFVWFVVFNEVSQNDELFQLDMDLGKITQIPLPEADVDEKAWISEIVSVGNTLYALIRKDNSYKVLPFRDGGWQTDLSAEFQTDVSFVNRFIVDLKGQAWFFVETTSGYLVGKVLPAGREIIWYSLVTERRDFYSFTMDLRGRVWLEGYELDQNDHTQDRIVEVYETMPDQTLQPLVYYSAQNSGYQDGFYHGLTQTPDGRIWSVDDNLAWIDGSLPDLPQPLPEWYTTAVGRTARNIYLGFQVFVSLGLLVFSLLYVVQLWPRRK